MAGELRTEPAPGKSTFRISDAGKHRQRVCDLVKCRLLFDAVLSEIMFSSISE